MQTERLNFCTLFNKSYLSRGILMIESLFLHEPNSKLFVLAFDSLTAEVLRARSFSNLVVIELSDFEDPELLKVKPGRTMAEYCWTCTSSILLYLIERYSLDHCTYLDADLVFYTPPRVLWSELGEDSIFITKHNYTEKYDQSSESGIYCVQYLTFKNDSRGLAALKWWRDACLEWCFNRKEDGKFGDQKYLDDWPSRFDGVRVMETLGAGIAPWNIQQFDLFSKGTQLFVKSKTGSSTPLVFFHFHHVTMLESGYVHFGPYDLDESDRQLLYEPYAQSLLECEAVLKEEWVNEVFSTRLKDDWIRRLFSKGVKKRLRPLQNQSKFRHG